MLGVLVDDVRCPKEREPRRATPFRPVWRRASVLAGAVLALLAAEAAHAQDSSAAKQLATVSVSPGSLDEGLAALGRQTNLKLVYPSALTTGKKTVGVAGRMPAKDAVRRVLAQTGLGFTVTPTGAVPT